MTRTPTSNTEKLNKLYEESNHLQHEINLLHARINLSIDNFFAHGGHPETEAQIDTLILESREKMERKKFLRAKIDKLLEDI